LRELADSLRAALGHLPPRQAEVFSLVCFEAMSCEQAACELGVRPAAARMLLSRARQQLQLLLRHFRGAGKDDK
jgi:RNA polymerase sigma factor (sigma-70 family)